MAVIDNPGTGAQPFYPPPGPVQKRSNGLAVAALVLGIVCVVASPIPMVNVLGFLVALVGFVLSLVALGIGISRSAGVGMSVWALVLCVVGGILCPVFGTGGAASFAQGFESGYSGTSSPAPSSPASSGASSSPQSFGMMPNYVGMNYAAAVNDLKRLEVDMTVPPGQESAVITSQSPLPGTPIYQGTTVFLQPAMPSYSTPSTPPASKTFTFKVEGSARSADIQYSLDGSSGSDDSVRVPWNREMTTSDDSNTVSLSASTPMGSAGSVTCTILGPSGEVVDQKTAQSQGGEYGSAHVFCIG